jgi:hypothetical protein
MAAGQGFKTFATGDILTAADANGYLMSQTVMVFADSAARSAAITSPQQGMVTFLKGTNSTEYYSGSAWVAIGGGGSSGALTLINRTSISAQTSYSFNNVFSSTYENYFITVDQTDASVNGMILYCKFRASGTDNSTNYYYAKQTRSYTNTSGGSAGANTTQFPLTYFETGKQAGYSIQLLAPQLAQWTLVNGQGTNFGELEVLGVQQQSTSQFDGFSLLPSSGNFTGVVSIYGYAKA